MGCIPTNMDEKHIREICEAFGMLRSFNLRKDPDNPEKHKGFAFFEYVEEKVTDRAVKALNGLDIGDKKLKVQRASIGQKVAPLQASNPVNSGFLNNVPSEKKITIPRWSMEASKVVQLLNILTPEDLMDDEDFKAIHEDILEACNKYGEVLEIKIPRPDLKTGEASSAVGKAFIKFSHEVKAKQARYTLTF